jgi:hypothetical protein
MVGGDDFWCSAESYSVRVATGSLNFLIVDVRFQVEPFWSDRIGHEIVGFLRMTSSRIAAALRHLKVLDNHGILKIEL